MTADRGTVMIQQMVGAPDYVRRDRDVALLTDSHAITAVNQGTKTFTCTGNFVNALIAGQIVQVVGSTGNDGHYTVVTFSTAMGNTLVVVAEAIPSAVADGDLNNNFDLLDSQSDKLPIIETENQPFLDDNNQYIYIGDDDIWYGFGILLESAGQYTSLKYEYLNGDTPESWVEFTPLYDSTYDMHYTGFLKWGDLENWGLFSVNNQLAYWIRISTTDTGITTGSRATWFNMLTSVVLQPVIVVRPDLGDGRVYPDVNGVIQNTDLNYKSVRSLTIDCTRISCRMEDLNILWFWTEERVKLWITDAARTNPVNYNKDAYWRNFVGKLIRVDDQAYSPSKMLPDSWSIYFLIQGTVSSIGAVEQAEYMQFEPGYSWVRDEGNTQTTNDDGNIAGDGGDAVDPILYTGL